MIMMSYLKVSIDKIRQDKTRYIDHVHVHVHEDVGMVQYIG
jgi:hypothetical protein